MADRVGPRVPGRILGPQAQQLAAQPVWSVLTRAISVEIGMGGDDRVHDADDLIRARRIAERDRQRLEKTKSTFAIAQIASEESAPAEFSTSDMRAALALYAGRQRGAELIPIDRRCPLTPAWQDKGVQGWRHRIVETEQQWPAGQGQLAGQCGPWIEGKAARFRARQLAVHHCQQRRGRSSTA